MPPADEICEHLGTGHAFVCDGRAEAFGRSIAFDQALKELTKLTESAQENWVVQLILESEAGMNTIKAGLIDTASSDVDLADVLQSLVDAETGPRWSMHGIPGGSGYNVYVSDPARLDVLSSACAAIIQACSMTIDMSHSEDTTREGRRPKQPDEWIMQGFERNVVLDGLNVADIEVGRVNDDQLQSMWGMTLEETQSVWNKERSSRPAKGAPSHADARYIAGVLHRAV